MTIERYDRTDVRRAQRPAGPATFDDREADLARTLRRHVMLRDACLAPGAGIVEKLDRLDLHLWDVPNTDGHGARARRCPGPGDDDPAERPLHEHSGAAGLAARVSVVVQMDRLRRVIRDTGSLLPSERRRLVLLDVLASIDDRPAPGLSWSRDPIDLIGEAATGIGHNAADVRRLARRLDIARHALPPVEIGPSITRTVAESIRGVTGLTPGAAVAHAVLLLSDRVPAGWESSAAGAVLLDPAPSGSTRYLGTIVARHDLAAFTDDLATLRVAAHVSPLVARYATAMLPDLAHDLRTLHTTEDEAPVVRIAADLTTRTAALVARGFKRFDRGSRLDRYVVTARR